MRKSSVFWGVLLILLGGLFLLDNLGFFDRFEINVGELVWPIVLILLGLWVLFGSLLRRPPETEHASIPLEDARRARLRVRHGAGRLNIHAGAGIGNLVEGDFGGGLEQDVDRSGDLLDVKLSLPTQELAPFSFGEGYSLDWSLGVARDLPLSLDLETGANEAQVDLSELLVNELKLSSGASSTVLTLPANAGSTRVRISTGAASVRVNVPQGVAARIHAQGGLASIDIDQSRFPKSGGLYQSADYETAFNKVDLEIETGVGSVDVR